MALVVDIKRQVSGRGSRALSHPSPEGSRAAIVRARRAPARLCTRCCARRRRLLFPLLAQTDVAIDHKLTSSQTMTMGGSIVICVSSYNRNYTQRVPSRDRKEQRERSEERGRD